MDAPKRLGGASRVEQGGLAMAFARDLRSTLIYALNEEYKRADSWWRALTENLDVFIAIRDDSLNIYRNGCSIAKVHLNNEHMTVSVHYKFLLKKAIRSPYVALVNGRIPQNMPLLYEVLIVSLADFEDLKYWTDMLGDVEKAGVHRILRANNNIVDVEIALYGGSKEDDLQSARIDFAAVQQENGEIFLRFFEAKDYSNSGLRAKEPAIPAVLKQINQYQKVLDQHRCEILSAYRKSIDLAHQLSGTNILGKALPRAILDQLQLDTRPRLVVFGFDADQKKGENFKRCMDVLRDALGNDRVLVKGDPRYFTSGIS
jgi:hypothetical protein